MVKSRNPTIFVDIAGAQVLKSMKNKHTKLH